MPKETLKLGVLARSHPPANRWATRLLRPVGVMAPAPATAPGTLLRDEDGVETWYLGAADLTLHSGDTAHYRNNLAGRPSVWVALRDAGAAETARVHLVTADPYEGEGLATDPGLTVEAVPMPDPLRDRIVIFFEAHHVEHVFHKRKRQAADPNAAMGRAPRILPSGDGWGRR